MTEGISFTEAAVSADQQTLRDVIAVFKAQDNFQEGASRAQNHQIHLDFDLQVVYVDVTIGGRVRRCMVDSVTSHFDGAATVLLYDTDDSVYVLAYRERSGTFLFAPGNARELQRNESDYLPAWKPAAALSDAFAAAYASDEHEE